MKILSRILGSTRGRWRYLVLIWYSFLFSTVLLYFTHFHYSARKLNSDQEPSSFLHSLKDNSLSRFFEDSNYLSLESLQNRFQGLSISRVFRTIVGEDDGAPSGTIVEDLVISGSEAEVDKLLRNVTSNTSDIEVKVVEKVNIPVTSAIDSTTLSYLKDLRTVKPTPPPLVPGYQRIDNDEPLRLHCSVCAVVASSGHLLNSSAGQEIDQYPCILRMNSATTMSFEDDVGPRTDIRVIGMVNMKDLKNHTEAQDEIFVNETTRVSMVIAPWLYVRNVDKSKDPFYLAAEEFATMYPSTEIYVLTKDKMKMAEEIFKAEVGVSRQDAKTWLTTGWMTMLFAIDVCGAIDVFGLAKDNHCILHPKDETPYHYYPPYDRTECSYYRKSEERLHIGHKFITEKAVFERWANVHKISFHFPHWQASNSTLNKTLETPFLKKYHEAAKRGVRVFRNGSRVVRRVVRRVVKKVIVRRRVPAKAAANRTAGKVS